MADQTPEDLREQAVAYADHAERLAAQPNRKAAPEATVLFALLQYVRALWYAGQAKDAEASRGGGDGAPELIPPPGPDDLMLPETAITTLQNASLTDRETDALRVLAAAVPGPQWAPTTDQIAESIEIACESSAIGITVTEDDGQPSPSPLYRLARCLDVAGLIDWSGVGPGDSSSVRAPGDEMVRALRLIAGEKCRSFTRGRCSDPDSGKFRGARYGADAWCDACIAQAALDTTSAGPDEGRRATLTNGILRERLRLALGIDVEAMPDDDGLVADVEESIRLARRCHNDHQIVPGRATPALSEMAGRVLAASREMGGEYETPQGAALEILGVAFENAAPGSVMDHVARALTAPWDSVARDPGGGADGDIAPPEVIEALARHLHSAGSTHPWELIGGSWPDKMRDRARDVLAVIDEARGEALPLAPDPLTQRAALRLAQLAAGDVLTQDDRDAIVRVVGELDDRWSTTGDDARPYSVPVAPSPSVLRGRALTLEAQAAELRQQADGIDGGVSAAAIAAEIDRLRGAEVTVGPDVQVGPTADGRDAWVPRWDLGPDAGAEPPRDLDPTSAANGWPVHSSRRRPGSVCPAAPVRRRPPVPDVLALDRAGRDAG